MTYCAISHLAIYLRMIENIYPYKDLYMNIYDGIICNIQKKNGNSSDIHQLMGE